MINQTLIPELKQEAASTRKLLEKVPGDKFDWKPHKKSMTLGRLATHVAEITQYVRSIITTDELNFADRKYAPHTAASTEELLQIFDQHLGTAMEALQNVSDETLMKTWTLRNGEHVIVSIPKAAMLRSMAMNHLVHHRGQLSVYLRLLDVPIPGMYGPSADERGNF